MGESAALRNSLKRTSWNDKAKFARCLMYRFPHLARIFYIRQNQSKGVLFSDPQRLIVSEYLERWLADTAK